MTLVAATVRSINHVRANSVYEDVIQEGDCESSLEFVEVARSSALPV